MDKALRNILRNTVVRCRRLLEEAIGEILQGQFGIHASGEIEEAGHLTHLSADDATYREQVLTQLAHIQSSGAGAAEAVVQLVRETAFTHLNRLCAFKMMEQRKLIRTAVTNGLNSNGFKFYLADHPEEERLWSEGRQDLAYRHFLEWLSAKHTDEIRVLFAPTDPANRLFPKQAVLDQVLALLNSEELGEVWSEDETIGWIYQYFTPKELRDQAHKESPAPRNSYELAFRNQFYTPRYVVEFLVDNTLGRTWYEMRRGQTILGESCRYLLRRPEESIPVREKKDPREIRVLDPACGSGHFLLYCFDLFLTIYEEAYADPDLGPRLRTEYPTLIDLRRAVPGLILAYNLHGIDIDPRATQIAALALWLRAQRAYREWGFGPDERGKITKSNLVCAEPMPGDREMLNEFVAGLKPPMLGQLVESVFDQMGRLAGEAGSLLMIEAEIGDAIHRARRQWLARPRHEQLALLAAEPPRGHGEQLEFDLSGITDEEFWREAEERVVESLWEYARRATNGRGFARQLFADDAAQGLAFVDLCRKQFDVVLMNPPFGEATKAAKAYLEKTQPRSKHDLACAFVERWLERCVPGGKLGAITTRTPFFLSSSTKWREEVILKEGALDVVADLGYGILDAMVETAAYTLSHGAPARPTTFLRLLKDEDKALALYDAVTDPSDRRRYEVEPVSFTQVPNSPLCYWVSDRVRRLFSELPPFEGEGRTARVGLQSSDDFRFVRLWTEVPPRKIYKKWFPFAKGGAYSPYYADLHLVVNWENDGEEIKGFVDPKTGKLNSRPQNTDFYFRPGLTWPRRTQKGLNFRVLPADAVFADKGPAALMSREQASCYVGLTNSVPFRFLVGLQMVFGSFEVGVIQRTPVPTTIPDATRRLLENAATRLVDIKRFLDTSDETTHVFQLPALLNPRRDGIVGLSSLADEQADRDPVLPEMQSMQEALDDAVFALYGIKGDDRREIEEFMAVGAGLVASEQGEEEEEEAAAAGDARSLAVDFLSYVMGTVYGRFDVRLATGERPIPALPDDPFAPLPVCSAGMLVGEDGLPATAAPEGYPLVIDTDGILVDDPENPDDIVRRVRSVFELVFSGRAETIEREACELLGVKELRDYFRNPQGFLAEHIKRYSKSRRKAPIYWLLQSSRKSYGLWLYYHRLDKDILFKALTLYVEPKIQLEENRLAAFREELRACLASGRPARPAEKAIERQELLLSDLQDFHERLERAAKLYLEPDLDDGVLLNIAPLYELVPWKEAKAAWKELVAGKYEWSSIGRQLRAKKLVKA